MSRTGAGLLLALAALLAACVSNPRAPTAVAVNPHAIVFYYNWYGSPEIDGERLHWSHPVLKFNPDDPDRPDIPGNGDIAADFYPALGEYSSADPSVVEAHMRMIAQAGIGIVAVTWLGEDDPSARSLPLLFDAAARHGLRVCFQIEPAARPDIVAARAAIVRIVERFGDHPAFHRAPDSGRPLFFVYDSYHLPAADWARLLRDDGDLSLRGGAFDAEVIGLWVEADEHAFFRDGGFDGFYTYFASRGFTYGSTPEHWPALQRWAADNGLRFVPSVGPGYIDARVRPWNGANTHDRDGGRYYDEMFAAALASGAPYIAITSFNEWHEGTQIEPAVPHAARGRTYLDYAPLAPGDYLQRTRHWLSKHPPGLQSSAPR
ncbi:glycoside hydrolase family 71/99 protein [Marilutibacter alkalisoli]|uniref:Alpha-mannosidase n=1 Tax=Marilutibacter alkalisoli TaxID=2591633 RepID=A0A514BP54_9GAMM|nr:alpha-mannosidase [Lysobacter alkalisoli]QDH69163.1 alpha-mannosidase [Lysobacter alkalisoli]